MNSFKFVIAFGLIAAVTCHSKRFSYVSRKDSNGPSVKIAVKKASYGEHNEFPQVSYDGHDEHSYGGDEKTLYGTHEEIAFTGIDVSHAGYEGASYGGLEEVSYGGHESYSQDGAGDSEKYSIGEKSYGHGVSAEAGSHGGDDEKHDYYAHPSYKYDYAVKDEKTGDHKSHWEHRDGDLVKGQYTLDDADGTKRIVSYTSDKKSGFNAVVQNIGHAHHAPAQEKKEEYHEYHH